MFESTSSNFAPASDEAILANCIWRKILLQNNNSATSPNEPSTKKADIPKADCILTAATHEVMNFLVVVPNESR